MAEITEKTEPAPLEAVENWGEMMQVEYDAWLTFMRHFYHLAGHPTEEEVNDSGKYDAFFNSLRTWSERLAQLRRPQAEVLELDERGFPKRRGPV